MAMDIKYRISQTYCNIQLQIFLKKKKGKGLYIQPMLSLQLTIVKFTILPTDLKKTKVLDNKYDVTKIDFKGSMGFFELKPSCSVNIKFSSL